MRNSPWFTAGDSDHFIAEWETTAPDETITLPLIAGFEYDMLVDWGDGNTSYITAWDDAETTHTYSIAGSYDVRISGKCQKFSFGDTGDKLKIKDVKAWGDVGFISMNGAFWGCSNMTVTATDGGGSTFSNIDGTSSMFRNALLANPATGDWDLSSCENISWMFDGAVSSNPDVSSWDVSNVTIARYVFSGAILANPDVSLWNTSSFTRIDGIFNGASSAHPDVSGWDVSNVYDFASAFRNMSGDPDVSLWDTSSATTLQQMFFSNTAANPDVSGWNTSSCENLIQVFRGATSAAPDVSGWDTSSTTDMAYMFEGATLANPDMSGWDVSSVLDMTNICGGTTSFSTANYDAALIAWDALPSLQSGVVAGFGSTQYSAGAAATAKSNIETNYSWVITDGGQVP